MDRSVSKDEQERRGKRPGKKVALSCCGESSPLTLEGETVAAVRKSKSIERERQKWASADVTVYMEEPEDIVGVTERVEGDADRTITGMDVK